jgi:hypothetical protein
MSLRTEIIRVLNDLVIFGKKITGLPAGGTMDGTELFESVQNGVSVKLTAQQIADLASTGGALPAGMFILVDSDYDLSTNSLPTTGGSGPGGIIKAGNAVVIGTEGTSFPQFPAGTMLVSKVDFPTAVGDWLAVYTIV